MPAGKSTHSSQEMCGWTLCIDVCASCALQTDFGPQSTTSYRPGWIKVLLLLAPLRPLRGREIWAPGIHAPCDSPVAQKVQRRFPFHSSGRRRIGSGMGPWASGGLVGSPPELGRRGAGGVVSAGCGSQAGRGPEPRGSGEPASKCSQIPRSGLGRRDAGANERPPSGRSWSSKVNQAVLDCNPKRKVTVCDINRVMNP